MNQPGRLSFRAVMMAALFVGTGCEDTTTSVALQLNLDRPVDVAFACYGGMRLTKPLVPGGVIGAGTAGDELVSSAQPLAACDVRTADRTDDFIPFPRGQDDLTASGGAALAAVSYYGLILQSGPGTVALAQFPTLRGTAFDGNEVAMLDADPLTPGKTSITVGATPVAIATDPSGCFALTANAGSCDLSTLDINSALKFDGQAKVERLPVTNGAGAPINARPAAMVATPGITAAQALEPNIDTDRIGQTCPAKPAGYVYVAYPSCHVVAAVNAATGKIEKGILFAADGTASIVDGAAVTCPDECAGEATTAGPHPVTLDLMNDVIRETGDMRATSKRLAIGSRDSNVLTVVDLGADSLPVAAAPLQVPLTQSIDGKLGVLDVALSPVIGMGNNNNGALVGDRSRIDDAIGNPQFQFVYAVATDGTVRVANVLNAGAAVPRECETRTDPRTIKIDGSVTMADISCLPVDATKRRVGAIGPGIPDPLDGVPSAVTIVRVQPPLADERARSPARLVGYFAVVTSTNGATYLVDIDDDDKRDYLLTADLAVNPLSVDMPTTLPHSLRDQVSDRGAKAQTTDANGVVNDVCNSAGPGIDETGNGRGGARLAGTFNRLSQLEVLARNKESSLPNLRYTSCKGSDTADAFVAVPEISFAAPLAERRAAFPDTQGLHAIEDWRIVWEGLLSGDTLGQAIDGLATRSGTVVVNAGNSMTVSDKSRPYCAAGVEPFDTAQLRGCDPASTFNQCPTGLTCYVHPEAATGQGACLPEKSINALSALCRDFLVSVRRYNIGADVFSGQLTLKSRMHVLRSTPLDGCTSDTQCKSLADYEAQQVSELHPKDAGAIVNARTFGCQADPNRKDAALKRCVMTCKRDLDCDAVSACVGEENGGTGVCMEGVIPPAECLAAPTATSPIGNKVQRYDLRASEAFVVLGISSTGGESAGYLHSMVADGTGRCVKNPATPLLQGRIPINTAGLPACIDGATSPNPCTASVPNAVAGRIFDADCNVTSTPVTLPLPSVPAIRFKNPGMVLNFVNQTYKGDLRCSGDAGGNPLLGGKSVPAVFTGMAFTFRQSGGYSPLPIRTAAVVPVRVLRGPQQSVWIVDEGDYLTENSGVPSTRGKVFRVETSALSVVNVLQ
jgi:hypothetical protein